MIRRLGNYLSSILLLAAALWPATVEAQGPSTCAQLSGTSIPASAIGLPTSGATVTSASTASTPGAGEYCKALVAIHPVDPKAPDILAQVNLPTSWNQKALMFGGGGYDGSIPSTIASFTNGPTSKPYPLGQGYATFSSNSGHAANGLGSQDGSFALSDESLHNFAGDALKKTRDAAVFLIVQRYGHGPVHSYFVGGSSGGREGLWVAQNTPGDFDGVISMYPAWNAATLDLQFMRITRAFAKDGAYPNPRKQLVWMNAVFAACDGLDGLKDGIISNVAACHFNPRTARVADGSAPLRCPGGVAPVPDDDSCLTDAQIKAIRAYGTPLHLSYPTASGESSYPGFNVFAGADLTGPLDLKSQQPTHVLMTSDQTAAAACAPLTQSCPYKAMPYFAVFIDQWAKYFITGDRHFDSLTLDPQHPKHFRERISDLTGLQDVNRTDLSAFQEGGGKLILMHGLSDGLVATNATVDYYLRLVEEMEPDTVASFVRFYTIPGLGHVFGSPAASGGGFFASWDPLPALDNWVVNGQAPSGLVATDQNARTSGRTRPVCEYPSWPKYNGAPALADKAASFTCVTQAADDDGNGSDGNDSDRNESDDAQDH